MRAAVTPGVNTSIEVASVDDPRPRSGEVLVKVHAASVNRLDRAVFEGKGLGRSATFPLIQGIDASGVVEAGSGSTPTGSRVVVKPSIACRRCVSCRAGRLADCENATLFGVDRQGGFAQYLAVPRTNVVVLPDSLSHAEAAAAAHTHAVAFRMIRRAGGLAPGSTMLVTGAGGAVGTAAVQLGVALGSRVVAVASTAEKREVARRLGATAVIDATSGDAATAVRDETGGGADLAIDTTGVATTIQTAYDSLARGGSLVLVAGAPGTTLTIDANDMYRTRRAVIGSAGSNDRDFTDVFRLMAEHSIHPIIAATFPLDQAQTAMDAVLDRERIGKIVVDVGGTP